MRALTDRLDQPRLTAVHLVRRCSSARSGPSWSRARARGSRRRGMRAVVRQPVDRSDGRGRDGPPWVCSSACLHSRSGRRVHGSCRQRQAPRRTRLTGIFGYLVDSGQPFHRARSPKPDVYVYLRERVCIEPLTQVTDACNVSVVDIRRATSTRIPPHRALGIRRRVRRERPGWRGARG